MGLPPARDEVTWTAGRTQEQPCEGPEDTGRPACTWAQEHEDEAGCLSPRPVALLVASVTDTATRAPRWPRKEAWDRHRLGGPAPSPHVVPSQAGGCGLALLSPGTGSPPTPDGNTQALQGPPHPAPRGPAPLRPCPEPPSPPRPQGAARPSAAGRHRTARPPGSSTPTLCTRVGCARGWRSAPRGALGSAGHGRSRRDPHPPEEGGPRHQEGAAGGGALAEGAEAGGGERGWEGGV